MPALDAVERAALALGADLGADLILIDDRKGRRCEMDLGSPEPCACSRAAQRELVDLADAIARLKRTTFHYRQELFNDLLKKHAKGGNA